MCCSPHVPSMMRGVIFALLFLVAAGVLVGPAGLRPETKSAEAVLLSEIKKLPSSQTDPFDRFGFSVAVSGDIAVVGAPWERVPVRHMCTNEMLVARTTGAR